MISVWKRPTLWLIVLAMILLEGSCITMRRRDVQSGVIGFAALYGTARDIRHGNAITYDATHVDQEDSRFQLQADSVPQDRVDKLHAPFESLLFLPLTFLPYTKAYLVWSAISIALFWLVPVVLWPYIPRLHSEAEVLALVYGSMMPVLVCLWEGQDSSLLLLLISLAFAALYKGHDFRAGVFLALGLFKFHLILPLVAALLVWRNWRAILGFLAGLLSLALLTLAAIGPRTTLGYMTFLLHYSNHTATNTVEKTGMMPNLRGLIFTAFSGHASPRTQSLLVFSVSGALLILLFAWLSRFRDLPLSVRYSEVVVVTSIVSYHYFAQNAVLLALPLLLLGDAFQEDTYEGLPRRLYQVAAVAMCGTLILGSIGLIFTRLAQIAMPALATESILIAAIIFAFPSLRKQNAKSAPKPGDALAG